MREVFVDTSAWAAITDSKDTNHIAATSFMKQLARKSHLVITNYILDEAYTLLLMRCVAQLIEYQQHHAAQQRQGADIHIGLFLHGVAPCRQFGCLERLALTT